MRLRSGRGNEVGTGQPVESGSGAADLVHLLQEIDKTLVRLVDTVEDQGQSLARLVIAGTDTEQAIVLLRRQMQSLMPPANSASDEWPKSEEDWVKEVQRLFGHLLTPSQQQVCGYLVVDACLARVADRIGSAPSTVGGHARLAARRLGLDHFEEIPHHVCSCVRRDRLRSARPLAPIVGLPSKRREESVVSTRRGRS